MSELRNQLGEDAYKELCAMVQPKPSEWQAWLKSSLKGSLKSWTMWAGAAIAALPEIAPQIPQILDTLHPDLAAAFGKPAVASFTRFVGVLIILLRVKTTKPLKERST